MTIDEITQWESALKERMPHRGFMEQRDNYLKEHGIYEEWQAVFKEYAKLALEGDLEALKRAVFFIWYTLAEPTPLHGIEGLDESLSQQVLGRLNSMCANGQLDAELKWMLPHYYCVCDFYLDRFAGIEDLLQVSRRHTNRWYKLAQESSFANRGQLGDYWSSISLAGPCRLRYPWWRAYYWFAMKIRRKPFDPFEELTNRMGDSLTRSCGDTNAVEKGP